MEVRAVDEAAVVVKCTGRLVYREEAATLICKVSDLLPDYRHIILDFAGVESIDSSGLGSLAMLCLRAKAAEGAIRLCNLHPRVAHMLRITNLNSVLEIYSTAADALALPEPAQG